MEYYLGKVDYMGVNSCDFDLVACGGWYHCFVTFLPKRTKEEYEDLGK